MGEKAGNRNPGSHCSDQQVSTTKDLAMNDLDQLNHLYGAWKDAHEAAYNAQHDIIIFMQQFLHGNQEAPPISMQTVADDLSQLAAERQAELSRFFHDRLV